MSLKISAKTEYACIAVMELAAQQDSAEPVRIRNIAERHSVPPRFLVQILLQLKAAGIVESTRGASGGYRLKKKPEDITLAQVMNIVDAPVDGGNRTLMQTGGESVAAVILNKVWNEAERRRQEYLGSVTFADLIRFANMIRQSKGVDVTKIGTVPTGSVISSIFPNLNDGVDPVSEDSQTTV